MSISSYLRYCFVSDCDFSGGHERAFSSLSQLHLAVGAGEGARVCLHLRKVRQSRSVRETFVYFVVRETKSKLSRTSELTLSGQAL